MQVIVNGEPRELDEPMTVASLLETAGLDRNRVAVERNGQLVRRVTFEQVQLAEGDELEIVTLVGGG